MGTNLPNNASANSVGALVIAAGLSIRMGRFKLTLPWGQTTVIGQVVNTLEAAGVDNILVVTGHRAGDVAAAIGDTSARTTHNAAYATGEMLSSIQAGLRAFGDEIGAALLCLGDQPQMLPETVRAVLAAGAAGGHTSIVVPSYQMRAGHPILLQRWLWPEILAGEGTLRDVLANHRGRRIYVNVNTPSILADLDTPADYASANDIR